jgi:Leucine-rich repeat (LRR) protein
MNFAEYCCLVNELSNEDLAYEEKVNANLLSCFIDSVYFILSHHFSPINHQLVMIILETPVDSYVHYQYIEVDDYPLNN